MTRVERVRRAGLGLSRRLAFVQGQPAKAVWIGPGPTRPAKRGSVTWQAIRAEDPSLTYAR